MRRRSILPLLLLTVVPLALVACAPASGGSPSGGGPDTGGADPGAPAAEGQCGEINEFLDTTPVAEADLNTALGFELPAGEKCISSRPNGAAVSTFVYFLDGDQATFDAVVQAAPAGGWILQGTSSTESAYFDFHSEGMGVPSDLPPDLIDDYIYLDYVTEFGPSYLPAEYVQIEFSDAG